MTQRIEKLELVALVAQRTKQDAALVEEITDAVLVVCQGDIAKLCVHLVSSAQLL